MCSQRNAYGEKTFTQGTLAIKYHKVLIVHYKRNWKRKSVLPGSSHSNPSKAKPFVLIACPCSEQNSREGDLGEGTT